MRNIIFILLVIASINSFARPTFEGIYKCQGFDPYLNTAYKGKIKVVPHNTVYDLVMEYDTGDKLIGTAGLWDDNTIAVVFQRVGDLKVVGLERYSYTNDLKKIQGYWVYLGKDKLGKEVCEKVSK